MNASDGQCSLCEYYATRIMACDGLADGPCPIANRNKKVTLCQGDLMLCDHCNNMRFGSKTKEQREKAGTKASAQMSSGSKPANESILMAAPPLLARPDWGEHSGSTPNVTAPEMGEKEDRCLIQPLLAYILFSMQSATRDNIKLAVLGRFSAEEILEAKSKLWESRGESLGQFPLRKESRARPEKEAHIIDILQAIDTLDKDENLPLIVIDAMSLGKIPRSHPEELNNISLCDRLNQLESRFKNMHDIMDRCVTENLAMKDEIEVLKSKEKKSYADVASPIGINQAPYSHPLGQMDKPTSNARRSMPNAKVQYKMTPQTVKEVEHCISDMKIQLRRNGNMDSHVDRKSECESQETIMKEFSVPTYHQKKERQRLKQIIKGKSDARCGVKGAPEPSRHVFIYRVDKDTTEDDIKNLLTENENPFTIRELKCLSHEDAMYKSFKLSVPKSHLHRLYDDGLWPDGIRLRKYTPKIDK